VDAGRPALSGRAALALAAVPVAFLALFFAYPLVTILARGFTSGEGLSLPAGTAGVVWFTVWQAVVSTALTLLAGLPLAWVIGRFRFRGRSLVRALVLVPFVLPTVVVATAFLTLLPGGYQRGVWAILAAHVYFNVAVVVRIVGGAWATIDARGAEAAAVLGAGPLRRAREVTLPRLAPALSAASALTFLFCFTSFGVVLILGGPGRSTLETEIYLQAARAFDLRAAAALSLLQLALVALALLAISRIEARGGGGRTAASPRDGLRPPTGRERAVVAAVLAVSVALLLLPVAMLASRSLTTGATAWQALFRETPALLVTPARAILHSVLFAAVAAALAVLVGGLAAIVLARLRPGALDALVLLPLGASAVMLGFGFLIAFDEPPLDFRSSWWLVPVAQALVAAPFVVRVVAPALRSIDPRLREAAAVLGASPGRAWREIDLPLVARATGVAAGFAFAIALGEFGATVFIARAEWPTLPVAIFRFLGRPGAENQSIAAALAVCLACLTVVVALVLDRTSAGRRGPL
jgi:thiamine transport system permease protein